MGTVCITRTKSRLFVLKHRFRYIIIEMAKHNDIGKKGEEIACIYLKKNGFKIIDRNYRHFLGEIDIVCEKSGKVIFCEVKTVSRGNLDNDVGFRPEENLHSSKLKKLHKIIEIYLSAKRIIRDWQINLVTVKYSPTENRARVWMMQVIES